MRAAGGGEEGWGMQAIFTLTIQMREAAVTTNF